MILSGCGGSSDSTTPDNTPPVNNEETKKAAPVITIASSITVDSTTQTEITWSISSDYSYEVDIQQLSGPVLTSLTLTSDSTASFIAPLVKSMPDQAVVEIKVTDEENQVTSAVVNILIEPIDPLIVTLANDDISLKSGQHIPLEWSIGSEYPVEVDIDSVQGQAISEIQLVSEIEGFIVAKHMPENKAQSTIDLIFSDSFEQTVSKELRVEVAQAKTLFGNKQVLLTLPEGVLEGGVSLRHIGERLGLTYFIDASSTNLYFDKNEKLFTQWAPSGIQNIEDSHSSINLDWNNDGLQDTLIVETQNIYNSQIEATYSINVYLSNNVGFEEPTTLYKGEATSRDQLPFLNRVTHVLPNSENLPFIELRIGDTYDWLVVNQKTGAYEFVSGELKQFLSADQGSENHQHLKQVIDINADGLNDIIRLGEHQTVSSDIGCKAWEYCGYLEVAIQSQTSGFIDWKRLSNHIIRNEDMFFSMDINRDGIQDSISLSAKLDDTEYASAIWHKYNASTNTVEHIHLGEFPSQHGHLPNYGYLFDTANSPELYNLQKNENQLTQLHFSERFEKIVPKESYVFGIENDSAQFTLFDIDNDHDQDIFTIEVNNGQKRIVMYENFFYL